MIKGLVVAIAVVGMPISSGCGKRDAGPLLVLENRKEAASSVGETEPMMRVVSRAELAKISVGMSLRDALATLGRPVYQPDLRSAVYRWEEGGWIAVLCKSMGDKAEAGSDVLVVAAVVLMQRLATPPMGCDAETVILLPAERAGEIFVGIEG